MCTLALYFQVFDSFPVLVAANRDEHYDRPASAPMALKTDPQVVAGTDLRAGGTWLGVNERGLLAAILNRRSDEAIQAPTRSRGLLCLDVLACPSAEAARECLAIPREPYQPFTLVVVDSRNAWFAVNSAGRIEIHDLSPGLHVFNNAAIHDDASEKRQRAYALFAKVQPGSQTFSSEDFSMDELQKALSDHTLGNSSDDPKEAICVHDEISGTISSSIILLSSNERRFRTLYCPGAPCRTRFSEAPSLDVQ